MGKRGEWGRVEMSLTSGFDGGGGWKEGEWKMELDDHAFLLFASSSVLSPSRKEERACPSSCSSRHAKHMLSKNVGKYCRRVV